MGVRRRAAPVAEADPELTVRKGAGSRRPRASRAKPKPEPVLEPNAGGEEQPVPEPVVVPEVPSTPEPAAAPLAATWFGRTLPAGAALVRRNGRPVGS